MRDETVSDLPEKRESACKIYIDRDLYITVDSRGYAIGPCFEGSLGCVIQITDAGGHAALKIPRLLADTIRENAWIVKLTETEVSNVLKARHAKGLMYADLRATRRLQFRRTGLANDEGNEDAARQEGGVILVSFEKGKNPRFCNVKFDEAKLVVYPEGAGGNLAPFLTEKSWAKLAAAQPGAHGEFSRPTFCSLSAINTLRSEAVTTQLVEVEIEQPQSSELDSTQPKDTQMLGAGILERAAAGITSGKAWFAALPAIVYDWAIGSLQEAIGEGHLREWHFRDHFKLFDVVIQGVCALHAKEMLHADIRPANILCAPADVQKGLRDPTDYVLSDFGSFGKPDILGMDSGSETGNSLIGPGVGAQRVTPFYSTERRTATERESADTALIRSIPPTPKVAALKDGGFVIRLGWRRRLLQPKTNKPNTTIFDQMLKDAERLISDATASMPQAADPLREGDRLRLREYIFHVVRAGRVEDDLVCVVRNVFGQVLHDRLGVYDPIAKVTEQVLSLSSFVELRQWSAATDLYGVGAICLYTLFCTGVQAHGLPKSKDVSNRGIDTLFSDLINVLESVPHFRIFWAQLETFRRSFEMYVAAKPTFLAHEIADHRVTVASEKRNDTTRSATEKRTLVELATDATNQLCQSAPHAKLILRQFDMNLAHFLLFMHFAMACLHRQSHLEAPEGITGESASAQPSATMNPGAQVPFCEDRVEKPHVDGAAKKANIRLQELAGYHAYGKALDGFKVDENKIHDFNPKPNVELLGILASAEADRSQAVSELAIARKETIAKLNFWRGRIATAKFGVLRRKEVEQLIGDVENLQKTRLVEKNDKTDQATPNQ